jgi:hypothetical protein
MGDHLVLLIRKKYAFWRQQGPNFAKCLLSLLLAKSFANRRCT